MRDFHTEEGSRRPRGLGILFSDWLEIPQKGAFIGYISQKTLEAKDGARRSPRSLCHLSA